MAFGLRLAQSVSSADFAPRIRKCYVPAAEASAMYVGQPVVHVGDSNDNRVKTQHGVYDPGILLEVDTVDGLDGNKWTGVITAIELANKVQDGPRYKPASTEAVLHVCDDPRALFEIEADGALTVDSIGLNAVMVNATAGSTATGLSSGQLDSGTTTAPSADASNPLFIEGLAPKPGNAWGNSNPIVLVRMNLLTHAPADMLGIA